MKEADIRPADLFQKYLDLCAIDAVSYFETSERKHIDCPACNGSDIRHAFEKNGFGYVICNTCGTLYQSPRPVREAFDRFYKDSPSSQYWARTFFPTVAEARRKHLFRPKVEEIARLCSESHFKPEVIADIGAGFGIFLEEWRHHCPGTRLIAIEPNPDMSKICREKHLSVTACFAEEATELYEQIDLVIAFEVIEHVFDPLSFCNSLRKLMRTGGRVLLTGLTVDGFDIQVLWESSKNVSPPHHINFMSVAGFEHLMKRAGFSDVNIFTPGKLDVDIVRNSIDGKPEFKDQQRFIHHLLQKDSETQKAFQKFLSDHQLSSHCWVWAQK
jgi:SAM-dependent methyltransferase